MNALSNLKNLLSLASIFAVSSSLTGCLVLGDPMGDDDDITITDDSCVSTCEARNDSCNLDFEVNCQGICDYIEEIDCDEELGDYNACVEDAGDICAEDVPSCQAEYDAFVACGDASMADEASE